MTKYEASMQKTTMSCCSLHSHIHTYSPNCASAKKEKKKRFSFSKSPREREQLYVVWAQVCYTDFFAVRLRTFHPLFLIWTKIRHYFLHPYEYCSKLHITYVLACIKHVFQTIQLSWVEFSLVCSEMMAKKVKWLQRKNNFFRSLAFSTLLLFKFYGDAIV